MDPTQTLFNLTRRSFFPSPHFGNVFLHSLGRLRPWRLYLGSTFVTLQGFCDITQLGGVNLREPVTYFLCAERLISL